MKLFFLLLLISLTPSGSKAQVQFWNIADVEDIHWLAARKTEKIKKMEVYQTGENGKRIHEGTPGEIFEYSKDGLLIRHVLNKYDWSSKKWNVLLVDSFFYNGNGQLSAHRSYEGKYANLASETNITYNNKQQALRQDRFSFINGIKEPDGYSNFEYNAKGQPIKLTAFGPGKKKDFSTSFSYDAGGNLTKTSTRYDFDERIEIFTWNNMRQLQGYQEFYGKELQKTMSYAYDADGRRIKKQTVNTAGYEDVTSYSFNASSKVAAKTYLRYTTASEGSKDSRHEFKEMVYSFYE